MKNKFKPLSFGFAHIPVSKVKPGVWLTCDDGFTCLKSGARRKVMQTRPGRSLYIRCDEGEHHLVGQHDVKNGKEVYVGFWIWKKKESK